MSKLVRVIAHWAETDYKCDAHSRTCYHYIIEGDGKEIVGYKRPEANENTRDGVYCAHTLNCNEGSIGVSCAAMLGAQWPGKTLEQYGKYPVTKIQFEAMCLRIAKLCKRYAIPVTKKTVLMHGEVQNTLGIQQRGKWDIGVLPYANLWTIEACGDYMRKMVSENLAKL
jgi:N-acetyl-anhydromuramyl-L-alanine amidase AmpD